MTFTPKTVLNKLVDDVHAGAIEYAGRANDVRSLEQWIASGDHDQAEYKAKQIIKQQQQFRDAQQNGLPALLQQLVDQVHAGTIEYAGRADDVRSLEQWIASGDHDQAEYKAKQIIKQQQQFRDAQQNGLPALLQQLVDQVHAGAIEYAGRAADVRNLEEWIASGDHGQAEYKAKQIIKQQQQFHDAHQNGLPALLQQLVDQVHAGAIEYAGRADDVRNLEEWIASGDHCQAEYKAKQITKQQQQFRDAQQNGLPALLQQLVDQVHAGAIEYAGRAADVRNLEEWIASGDHGQAEYKVKQIIKQQQNSLTGL